MVSKRILTDVEMLPVSLSAIAQAVCKSTVFGCLTFSFIAVVIVLVLSLSFAVYSSFIDTCTFVKPDCVWIGGGAYCSYIGWPSDLSIGN